MVAKEIRTASVAALPWATDVWQRTRDIWQQVVSIWNFQLLSVDGRPLTVGKVVVAILVLVVGLPIARRVIRRIARRIFARIGLEPGAAAAFETLVFYAIGVCLVVFALWVAEIPLTVFTLAGGAIAIGVGFGSQKIVNNFISGCHPTVRAPDQGGRPDRGRRDLRRGREHRRPQHQDQDLRQFPHHRSQRRLPRAERDQLDALRRHRAGRG